MNIDRKITAGKQHDAEGHPKVFTLTLGTETVTLDPGKTWIKADVFKWVTRGLIEEPQSFHVLADGTVDVNGEKVGLLDPAGIARLEHEMNKRHAAPAAFKAQAAASPRAAAAAAQAPRSDRVQFKVRVDHLGHLMVECRRGSDRGETGLRGLPSLIQNGLMLKPKNLHVDPLLRAVEIDGTRFECDGTGAQQLEQALNAHYAPKLQSEADSAVEIKENPAASTGFDIRFVTLRAGARFEIKGHLSQDNLDILQDPNRCELLKPGIVLRLSPPFLLIRHRRHDGSEERMPEFPDVQYRHIAAHQLQKLLNHPLIRRTTGTAALETASETEQPKEIVAMGLERNPHNKSLLWLKCLMTQGGAEGKAFTHHNVVDLQHRGVFRSEFDVSLSLDHRTLGILNKLTNQEDKITVDSSSSDEDLAKASQLLTAALKPPSAKPSEARAESKSAPEPQNADPPRDAKSATTTSDAPHESTALESERRTPIRRESEPPIKTQPAEKEFGAPVSRTESMPDQEAAEYSHRFMGREQVRKEHEALQEPSPLPLPRADLATAASNEVPLQREAGVGGAPVAQPKTHATPSEEPPLDAAVLTLFQETDPLLINVAVFRCLTQRLGVPAQDVALSLERVFENRRFQVISFTHPEVTNVLELRSDEFTGFYLSHVSERKILLVYARDGKHIEWGTIKCALQASVASEPDEFRGSALLGLAQNRAGHFVFVVTPEYKNWTKSRAKTYEEAGVNFATVKEIAAAPGEYLLIWPEPVPTTN
ncbi:MAG: hypothetical protein HYY23_10740 [Verrucomicrobia bacterium]|nr:hypothetical protein [Verrucomicrobiota bacterium]